MIGDVRHAEVEELLGAYALDAVDDDERAAVEAHLATCPRCRAEVDAHREVAAHLAQTGAPAPDALWDRIAGSIGGEAPPPMRLVVDHGEPSAPPSPAARTRAQRWFRPMLAVAAALVVVAMATTLLWPDGADDDGRGGLADAALAAFGSADARTAELLDADGRSLARVAVLPDGTGYVLAGALPDLDEHIYQLWGATGEVVVSLGTMGPAPQIVAFHADPAMEQLMITEEEAPVQQSANPAVVAGVLS
jgi:anti-sigma factor RsiW